MRSEEKPIPPIGHWQLRNFKSVERAEIDFAPLTVLVGANSSGKSSLVQSILLVAQASRSTLPHAAVPLNGPLQNLGTFKDVRFAGDKSRGPISLGGVFAFPSWSVGWLEPWSAPQFPRLSDYRSVSAKGTDRISWNAEFLNSKEHALDGKLHLYRLKFSQGGRQGPSLLARRVKNPPKLDISSLGISSDAPPSVVLIQGELRFGLRGTQRVLETGALLHKAGIPEELFVTRNKNALSATREIVGILSRYAPPWLGGEPTFVPDGPWEEAILAAMKDGAGPRREENVKEILAKLIRGAIQFEDEGRLSVSRKRFEAQLRELVDPTLAPRLHAHKREIYEILNEICTEHGSDDVTLVPGLFGDPHDGHELITEFIDWGTRRLNAFFSRCVLYLGPLREQPQVLYPATGAETVNAFLGNRGEYAYCTLYDHAEEEIDCPMPPCGSEIRQSTLHEAVNVWLRELGVADRIDIELRPRFGVQPGLKVSGVPRHLDLTALGVGASQVLPLLVMGLHSQHGTVLLIEQPELHLHPAVQQKLGDFLLACARSGKQVIVETHSDHLVSRLRRRIAEDEDDELVDYVKFLFVERMDGRSRFTPVPVNRYGGLERWPRGFFDQSASELQELMEAGMKKRKSARASSQSDE